jgi:hypothetical protein
MVGRGGICGVREVELMGRVLKPGPASMEGLGWLARVGPAPLDAWRCAMGWSEVAARSHARRLETEGWLERYPMTRGSGSLFVATRTGVRVLGLPLRAAGPPAPTWWAHHCAGAWIAAYLHVGPHRYLAEREVLEDDFWSGQIRWTDGKGQHQAGHRPDLIGFPRDKSIPFEVELTHKSMTRLRAIIQLHAAWRSDGRSNGVLYVCGDQDVADRVRRAADQVAGPNWSGIDIRPLSRMQQKAVELGAERRAGEREPTPGTGQTTTEALTK